MALTVRDVLKLRAQDKANQQIGSLVSGAEAFALLCSAIDSGVIGTLTQPRTVPQIAVMVGSDQDQVGRVLHALESFGFVIKRHGIFRLSKELMLLSAADAPLPLGDTLQVTKVRMRTISSLPAASMDYTALETDEIFAVAQSMISAQSFSRNFVGTAIGQLLPEVKSVWNAGAQHLEAGCGVGNNLFQILTTFPNVKAVGIEIEPSVRCLSR